MPLLFAMQYKILIQTYVLVAYAFVGWLSFARPDLLLSVCFLTGFCGYFLIFISFLPMGTIPFGEDPNQTSFLKWFWQLLMGQLVMLFLAITAATAFFNVGPSITKGTINLNLIIEMIEYYGKWQWGLFPWGMYGLWALVLLWGTHVKKGIPYFYQIARGFCPKIFEPTVKATSDSATFGATVIAISLISVSIILLITRIVEENFHINHYAVPFITISFLSLFAPFATLKIGRRYFKRLATKGITLGGLLNIFTFVLIFLLIGAAVATLMFVKEHPELFNIRCQECENYFGTIPWEYRLATLYWGWWLVWMPIAGSYLAKISRGRTLREFVFGLFIIPVILIALKLIWGEKPFVLLMHQVQLIPRDSFYLILAMISWMIMYRMTKAFRNTALFYSGLMPVPDKIKQSRFFINYPSKMVGLSKFSSKLLLSIIGTLFLHTMAGWYGLQIQLGVVAFLVAITGYVGLDFIILRFFKDKAWLGNQNIPSFSEESKSRRHPRV